MFLAFRYTFSFFLWCLLTLSACVSYASAPTYFPNDLPLNPLDQASLQRGAQIYFNHCSGCHSMQYAQYAQVARVVGVQNAQGHLYEDLIQKSLLFEPGSDISQPIVAGMAPDEAKKWFGVPAPDLTNITRVRSPAWVYNFLRAYYRDDTRTIGANNLVLPNTAMPNVLLPLRGETVPVMVHGQFDHFVTTHPGAMSPLAFDRAMFDLVNFLDAMAEPQHIFSIWIGIGVVAFLLILLALVYFWRRTLVKEKEQ